MRRALTKGLFGGLFLGLLFLVGCAAPVVESIRLRRDVLSRAEAETRFKSLESNVPAKPQDLRLENVWEDVNYLVRKARFLKLAYRPSETVNAELSDVVQQGEVRLQEFQEGVSDVYVPGTREEAYFAANDGSFQPFVRHLPARGDKPWPLLVFLHGYSPYLDIVNWSRMPPEVVDFCDRNGFALVAPFGRSNTDFQGIGEQDVLTAIDEMTDRYPIDESRIILLGHSMGGMGAWTIGSHYPDYFAGLVIVSARGDYYFWQGLLRDRVPSYKRDLIDAEFAFANIESLSQIPILSFHGTRDSVVPVEEGRHMMRAVRRMNREALYEEIENEDHWIMAKVLEKKAVERWMKKQRRRNVTRTRFVGNGPVFACGPVKKAFLTPFLFVCTAGKDDKEELARFRLAAVDWYRFAKSYPRVMHEKQVALTTRSKFNLFVFGEPENSALMRAALKDAPIRITGKSYVVGKTEYPRKGNGLYLIRPNPWNRDKFVVIQSGKAWGEGLPENHKYDFIPDFIVYSEKRDLDGSNIALCAGFFTEDWGIDERRVYRTPAGDAMGTKGPK